jgi:hypothetical protein
MVRDICTNMCFKPKVSQNGQVADFAAGFHLSSVAIIWLKLGHELTRDMLSMKSRGLAKSDWIKVLGEWAEYESQTGARNAYHVHSRECPDDNGALVVLDPWPPLCVIILVMTPDACHPAIRLRYQETHPLC